MPRGGAALWRVTSGSPKALVIEISLSCANHQGTSSFEDALHRIGGDDGAAVRVDGHREQQARRTADFIGRLLPHRSRARVRARAGPRVLLRARPRPIVVTPQSLRRGPAGSSRAIRSISRLALTANCALARKSRASGRMAMQGQGGRAQGFFMARELKLDALLDPQRIGDQLLVAVVAFAAVGEPEQGGGGHREQQDRE